MSLLIEPPKNFFDDKMPCLDYCANAFWYTLSIIAFNLFLIFKRNIACFQHSAYPNTIRRKIFDLAGKIVAGSRSLKLRISKWKIAELKLLDIWQRSLIPWLVD
ncbi:MAG: transposase [Lentisphaerales bacterium]|nr:transposase [Lentisphaerales bacterium]